MFVGGKALQHNSLIKRRREKERERNEGERDENRCSHKIVWKLSFTHTVRMSKVYPTLNTVDGFPFTVKHLHDIEL